MKAQCCICAEHFINDAAVAIAAVPCGHTFHEACLAQWLKTSNTCPSCRARVDPKRVINRLFFDGGDEEEVTDLGKIQNEIQTLKATIAQKERDHKEVLADNKSVLGKLKTVEKSKKEVELRLSEEQSTNSSLKKQLSFYQNQQKTVDGERAECKKIKQKFVQYQNIERLLTACEGDIQDMLQQYEDAGKDSVQSLATYCGMLKREYEKVKHEKKNVKTDFEKYKRENMSKDHLLKEKEQEISLLREQLNHSEEDLKKAEKERHILKRRIMHIRKIGSNSLSENSANASFIDRMTEESPAVSNPTTPLLFDESNNSIKEINLEKSKTDVSPEILRNVSQNNKRPHEDHKEVKYLKIGSALTSQSQNPSKKARCNEGSDLQGLSHFNIFKKKSGVGDYSSSIRKGYNGLGCVETFTEPSVKPRVTLPKKSVSRVNKNGKKLMVPRLPTLDGFITVD